MHQTVTQEQARAAAYYGRGGAHELIDVVALEIADGVIDFREGVDRLMEEWDDKNPEPGEAEWKAWDENSVWVMDREGPAVLDDDGNPIILANGDITRSKGSGHWVNQEADPFEQHAERRGDAEMDITARLDVRVDRLEQGLDSAMLAVVRPDIKPHVAEALGIPEDRFLTNDQVNALLAGRRADGELIEGKQYSVERAMPVDKRTGEQKWSTPIGSYDFCPSPDKSVSVAWGFANDTEQALILNAMTTASHRAVSYIADEVGKVRVGKGGEDGTEEGDVAWLSFTHHTSRRVLITNDGENGAQVVADSAIAGDPDLHIHNLMVNAVFSRESDKVGSLDTMAVRGFIFEADALFHNELASELRAAGFEVEMDPKTGAARMTSVPDEAREHFSKRKNKGVELAKAYTAEKGEVWEDLSDEQRSAREKMAIHGWEQKSKGGKDDVANVADWRTQARDILGWEPTTFQLYGPPVLALTGEARDRAAYEHALPFIAVKLEHEAVITNWDIRAAAFHGLTAVGGENSLEDVKRVTRLMWTEGVEQYGEKTALQFKQEPGERHVSVTTVLHERQENEFVRIGKAAAADRSQALPVSRVRQEMAKSGLDWSSEHGKAMRAAGERAGASGKFTMIIAASGAGKTTLLKVLTPIWKERGNDVWGASLASRQTDDLVDGGISPYNLKAVQPLLAGLDEAHKPSGHPDARPIQLTEKSVVVIDEWGLLGTRQGLELMRHQERLGFSVVALGDEKQAEAVESGNIVDLGIRILGKENVPEINTTMRQKGREAVISGLLRAGEARDALDMKREDGKAEMALGGREGTIAHTAKVYVDYLKRDGKAPGINTPTNADAHDISVAVRAERRKLGLIGDDIRTLKATDGVREYDLPIARGDNVRLFKSVHSSGRGGPLGRNGSVLEVLDVNAMGLTARSVKSGREGIIPWHKLTTKSGRVELAYGDAMTGHSSQGTSRNAQITSLPSGSQSISANLGYSMLTRHYFDGHLITSEHAERTAVRRSRPLNDMHPVTESDKWAMVAKVLAYYSNRDTATALRERAGQMRTGAVRQFNQMMNPHGKSQHAHAAVAVQQHGFMVGVKKDLATMTRAMQGRVVQAYQSVSVGMRHGW